MTKENKKIIAELVAISLMTGGAIYETEAIQNKSQIKETYQKVLEVFAEDTKLDEVVNSKESTYKNMSIVEAIDILEENIEIVEILKEENLITNEQIKLTKEDYAFAETLTKEDVLILLQVINSEKEDNIESKQTKQKAIKILEYVNNEKQKWINNNGRKVVLKALSWTVKSSMADDLDLPIEEIQDIELPPLKKINDMDFYTIYKDEKYYIDSKSETIFEPLYYYYQIKTEKDLQGEENKIYKEAINSVKTLTMTGINTHNHELTNVRKLNEAKKELKKY